MSVIESFNVTGRPHSDYGIYAEGYEAAMNDMAELHVCDKCGNPEAELQIVCEQCGERKPV